MGFSSILAPNHRQAVARRALGELAALVALLAGGCDLPGQPDPGSLPEAHDATGLQLYKTHCAGCHGDDGRLGPAPPLNDRLFAEIMPRDELLRVVSRGRPGTPMPAFSRKFGGSLSEEQISMIRWPHTGEQPHPKAKTPDWLHLDRAIAAGDASQGLRTFQTACAPCHGSRGQGAHGAGAIHDREFLELASDQLLRRIIITGRPDLGMPDYSESEGRDDDFKALDKDEIDNLVALLAAWRRGETVETR